MYNWHRTQSGFMYIFRRLMRLRGGMSAITFIDSCGHNVFTYTFTFSDAQRLSCYFILNYFRWWIEQNHASTCLLIFCIKSIYHICKLPFKLKAVSWSRSVGAQKLRAHEWAQESKARANVMHSVRTCGNEYNYY